MSLVEEWKNEIPCQFQGGSNLNAVIDAVGAQLTELETVFSDLIEKTDVKYATGKNLDMVGDIVGISRNDAYNLLELTQTDELDDTSYRNVLYFQILKNNADGTYEDIMKGLHLLWGDEAVITYKENVVVETYNGATWNKPDPAALSIDVADIPSDVPDPTIIKPMVIRPGGVKLLFTNNYRDQIEISEWEHFTNLLINYDKYNRYDGTFAYDGAIQYDKIGGSGAEAKNYISHNGEIQFNGKYMFDALGRHYNRFDGKYTFDGTIQWGPIEGAEEPDTVDAVLLNQAKLKMLKMRAIGSDAWQIKYFAFGTGLGDDGKKYTPTGKETTLKNEVARIEVIYATKLDDRSYQYLGEIPEETANGEYISEMGLVDSEGDLVCIKTFDKKLKRNGAAMVFKIDDIVDIVY